MNVSEDRIIKFLDACYDAGIKQPEAFIISKMPQVYNWLKGCFPRGILPTDIDGEIEINGHFLRLEFKHESALQNGRISKGQHKAFTALLDTGKFTVFYIGTDDGGEPTCAQLWYENRKIRTFESVTKDWVKDQCAKWAEHVGKKQATQKAN